MVDWLMLLVSSLSEFGQFVSIVLDFFIFLLGFTPCMAEQQLLDSRKICTERLKHTGNLFRKNLQVEGVC